MKNFLKKIFKYQWDGSELTIGNWYTGFKNKTTEIMFYPHAFGKNCSEFHLSLFGWYSIFNFPHVFTKHNEDKEEDYGFGFYVLNGTMYWEFGFTCGNIDLKK